MYVVNVDKHQSVTDNEIMPAKFIIPVSLATGVVLGLLLSSIFGFNRQIAKIEKNSPLFETQIATIEGAITQVSGSQISVKDKNGKVGQFPASSKLVVFKRDPNLPVPESFNGTAHIEPDKVAKIVLELEDGQFKITSIHYSIQPKQK